MNIKKIIAREFLFLLSILFLLTLVLFYFEIINAYHKIKIDSNTALEKKYQSFLDRPLKLKDSIIDQVVLNEIVEFYGTKDEFTTRDIVYDKFPQLKNDSKLFNASRDYQATINSGKYKSLKEVNLKFPEFFIINKSVIDSLSYFHSEIELSKKVNKIFSRHEIVNNLQLFGFWLGIIFFVLRYLFYMTQWAIITLK